MFLMSDNKRIYLFIINSVHIQDLHSAQSRLIIGNDYHYYHYFRGDGNPQGNKAS